MRERVRGMFRKRELEQELDDEVEFHLEMQTAENVRLGMSPEEARRRAVLLFGGVQGHKEAIRDARFPRVLEDFWDDARYGARTLRRNPGFAAAAVLTLALGIGVATAVFGVADQLFFRPLPLREPERLVSLTLRVNEGMSVNTGTIPHASASRIAYPQLSRRLPSTNRSQARQSLSTSA